MTETRDGSGPDPTDPTMTATGARWQARQIRGSTLLTAGRVASMVFTVATQIIIVRALGKAEYGVFAYALAISASCRLILSLGLGKSLSRFITIYVERGDTGRVLGTIILAMSTIAATSVLLYLGMSLAMGGVVSSLGAQGDVRTVLWLLLLLAPMEALDLVFLSLFAVFSKPRAIFFRKYVLTPLLRLVVVLVLVLTGQDVVFLAAGYVAAQVVGLAVYAVLLRRLLHEREITSRWRWRELRYPVREVWPFAAVMMTTDAVSISMNSVSAVILAHSDGPLAVASYRAVVAPARLNQFVFQSFVVLFLPMATRFFVNGDVAGMRRTYWRTAVLLTVLSFPVFALTVPFASQTTVALFGDRYADSASVLAILSTGYFLNAALGFNTLILMVYGRLRFLVTVNLAAAALNVALSVLLVPVLDARGVAVANCLTLVLQNIANQIGLVRVVGGSLVDVGHRRPYVAVVAATGLLVVAQLLLDPGVVVAAVIAATVSVGLLLATRRWLDLAETFPELLRVPVLRRLLV